MKKILTILCVILLLTGCNKKSGPEEAVEKAITQYKELLKTSTVEEALEGSNNEIEYTLTFMQTIYDFDYIIKSVDIDKDTSTVTVVVKTMDLDKLLTTHGDDKEVIEASDMLNKEEDETKTKQYIDKLTARLKVLAAEAPKDYESELTIPLIKENDEWIIEPTYDLNSCLSEAILGSAL